MGRLRTYEHKLFNSASLTASYQNFGAVLTDEAVAFTIHNLSDVAAYVSVGGAADDLYVPAGKEVSINAFEPNKAKLCLAKGAQLKIKQVTAAGTGSIVANIVLEG